MLIVESALSQESKSQAESEPRGRLRRWSGCGGLAPDAVGAEVVDSDVPSAIGAAAEQVVSFDDDIGSAKSHRHRSIEKAKGAVRGRDRCVDEIGVIVKKDQVAILERRTEDVSAGDGERRGSCPGTVAAGPREVEDLIGYGPGIASGKGQDERKGEFFHVSATWLISENGERN